MSIILHLSWENRLSTRCWLGWLERQHTREWFQFPYVDGHMIIGSYPVVVLSMAFCRICRFVLWSLNYSGISSKVHDTEFWHRTLNKEAPYLYAWEEILALIRSCCYVPIILGKFQRRHLDIDVNQCREYYPSVDVIECRTRKTSVIASGKRK